MAKWKWSFAGLIPFIVFGSGITRGESGTHATADSIEQAKGATIGILRFSGDSQMPDSPGLFSIRGTGFHFRDGYIVTAQHAVERQEGSKTVILEEISVMTEKLEELKAKLIGVNAFLDLTLYQLLGEGATSLLPELTFAGDTAKAGDEVFTVGYPLGWGPALGYGRLGNPNTFLPTAQTRLMQLDLSACSGNSGGGLFNAKGEIVGMVHAIIQTESDQGDRRCSRFAFAVPGNLVQHIVTGLINGSHPGFPRIGISMAVEKVGVRWRVAVSKASGPAKKGGIRKGDILLSIDDTEILSPAQLKNFLIENRHPGQKVMIRVLRGKEEKILTVKLGKA